MALVGLVAASIAGMMVGAQLNTTVADHVTTTTAVAISRIEVLASMSFVAAPLQEGGSLDSSADGYSEDPWAEDERIYVRWRVVDESSVMKRIDVVAGIRGAAGGSLRESLLSTYKLRME